MKENKTGTMVKERTATKTLDYWKMKNLSTCEFDSTTGFSAWSEWDKITDASEWGDNDNSQDNNDDDD